jgi:hypothetical protein
VQFGGHVLRFGARDAQPIFAFFGPLMTRVDHRRVRSDDPSYTSADRRDHCRVHAYSL